VVVRLFPPSRPLISSERREGIHLGVATAVGVLCRIAHVGRVTPTNLRTAVQTTGELTPSVLHDAVFGISQERIGGEVAVIVPPPNVRKGRRVVIHATTCPRRDVREPIRGTRSGQIVLDAATGPEHVPDRGEVAGEGGALVRRTDALDQTAGTNVIQTGPVIRVQMQRGETALRMGDDGTPVYVVVVREAIDLLRKQVVRPVVTAIGSPQFTTDVRIRKEQGIGEPASGPGISVGTALAKGKEKKMTLNDETSCTLTTTNTPKKNIFFLFFRTYQ